MSRKKLPALRRPAGAGGAGFTLIEVLVVVAIIALLVAILLPSLQKARETTRRVACMAQLKEISKGLSNYLNTQRERIPDADTLGGWWFRYNVGEKSDRFASPEYFGMPALLQQTKCLPAKGGLWLCPDTPARRLFFKNSYAWGMFYTTRQKVGGAQGEREEDPNSSWRRPYSQMMIGLNKSRPGRVMWVWDNWRFNAPTPTGTRYKKPISDPDNPESSSSGDAYLKISPNEQYYPHSPRGSMFVWGGSTTGAKARNINVLRLDHSVMRFNPDAGF